jgi:hypothetical protein
MTLPILLPKLVNTSPVSTFSFPSQWLGVAPARSAVFPTVREQLQSLPPVPFKAAQGNSDDTVSAEEE